MAERDFSVKFRLEAEDQASAAFDRMSGALGRYEQAVENLERAAAAPVFDNAAEAAERAAAETEKLASETERLDSASRSASGGSEGLSSSLGGMLGRVAALVVGTGALLRGFRAIIQQTPQFQTLSNEIKGLASRFTIAASVAIETSGALDGAAGAADRYKDSVTEAGTATGNFIAILGQIGAGAAGLFSEALDRLGSGVVSLANGLGVAGDAVQRFTGFSLENTAAVNKQAESQIRLNNILTNERTVLGEVNTIAKELGVTLSNEVIAKTDALAVSVEQARAAAAANIITWQDYETIAAAAAEKAAVLRGEVTAVGEASSESAEFIDELSEITRLFGDDAVQTSGEARQLTGSLNALAAAASRANAQLGSPTVRQGLPGRTERNQAQVDAAVRGGVAPILGGTRQPIGNFTQAGTFIRTGSRLVTTRSF